MSWISTGISTTVIGMGVVFSVLIILAFITRLLLKVVDDRHSHKDQQSKTTDITHTQKTSPVAISDIEDGADPITIAIIMAAVSAASGVVQSNLKFTAIRRSNAYHSCWAEQGTNAIINSRQFSK